MEKEFPQWESLGQCQENYCYPVQKYISCEIFGYSDGMNGGCHWCLEMTPYQWYMCQDEGFKRSLMKQKPHGKGLNEGEAIEFIQERKSRKR